MAEYFEREKLYDFLTEQLEPETGMYRKGRNDGINIARSALHNRQITPAADVVEVVRCKDCKRCFKHTTRRYKQTMWLCMRHDFNVNVHPDGFCSYGERRPQDGH